MVEQFLARGGGNGARVASTAPITDLAGHMAAVGFTHAPVWLPPRMIASIQGVEKTGKTDLALTATPPLFILMLDEGSEEVVNKTKLKGIEVYDYRVHVPDMSNANQQKDAQAIWSGFKSALTAAYKVGRGSVIIDTETEMYNLSRYARWGKLDQVQPNLYGALYRELDKMLEEAYNAIGMNTIFIHKMGPEHVDKGTQTGKLERKGRNLFGFKVQHVLETVRRDMDAGGMPFFGVTVKDSRKPEMNNFTLWDIPGEGQPKQRDLQVFLTMVTQ